MPGLRHVPSGQAALTDVAEGPPVLGVAELNQRVKALLENETTLRGVRVQGEVSNCRPHRNGHLYFTLKQDGASVDCVMWRSHTHACPPGFKDGLEVVVVADVTLYPAWGKYQLQVREIEPAGEGALWLQLARLKKRLADEGLFDAHRKRPLPRIPLRIGVVTSQSGAALHDILNVLRRRAPYLEVVVADARVQGDGAAGSIVAGLRRMAAADVEVIIVGRGGGSLEDLWAFNEEPVIRAVATCPVPIISAVGHETDNPLTDLAADLRCPTPSAAAESVAPSVDELIQDLDGLELRMARRMQHRLEVARHRFDALAERPLFVRPDGLLLPFRNRMEDAGRRMPRALRLRLEQARARLGEDGRRLPRALDVRLGRTQQRLHDSDRRLPVAMQAVLGQRAQEIGRLASTLDALSPLKVLARGYGVAMKDGERVTQIDQVSAGDALDVRVVDGIISTTVGGTKRRPTKVDPQKEQ